MRMSLCVCWDFYWGFCFSYISEEKSRETHMHMSCRVCWDLYGAFCFINPLKRSPKKDTCTCLAGAHASSWVPSLVAKYVRAECPKPLSDRCDLLGSRGLWNIDFQLWYTPTLHVELVVVLKNIVFLRAKRKPPVAPRVIVQLHRCRTRNCEWSYKLMLRGFVWIERDEFELCWTLTCPCVFLGTSAKAYVMFLHPFHIFGHVLI